MRNNGVDNVPTRNDIERDIRKLEDEVDNTIEVVDLKARGVYVKKLLPFIRHIETLEKRKVKGIIGFGDGRTIGTVSLTVLF